MKLTSRKAIATLLGVAAIGSSLFAGGSAGATSAPDVPDWAADIAHPATPKCAADETPVTPVTAKHTAHGGVRYTFDIGGNAGFMVVPPAGFQPIAAASADLAEMNLPDRPKDSKELTKWQTDMSHFTFKAQPAFCVGKPSPNALQSSTIGGAAAADGGDYYTHMGSKNWAGYVNTGNLYNQVAAHWTVPGRAGSCGCGAKNSTWVGLGGVNGGPTGWGLIQDGTELDDTGTPSAWYEWISGQGGIAAHTVTNVDVGDQIAAAVSWSGSTATFGMTDNNSYIINFSVTLASNFEDESTAEYISETPSYSCSTDPSGYCVYPLTNSGTTYFSQARAWIASSVYNFTALPYESSVITKDGNFYQPPCSGSSLLQMYPENASGQNFDVVWCRY